ncbi:hypothetical protein [Rugamonas apoptosis]|uniref:SMODS and SLOG-associating 2TM effector domain-containing protein n=1 Tax=Rugamonas apoptosis TaxID=2758570 RepID=A0A7W2FD59_9BURK|nr:hypothetical protein [Rugamonas apoptosis]MBA5689409.1 hypothetical protein [Rugamonas apoptosis]
MATATERDGWDALAKRLHEKRAQIAAFNHKASARGAGLTNTGIIASALAAMLTAAPAVGGLRLTQALGSAGENSPSWRILCAVASLCSLAAAIATNLLRTHDIAARLAKAQAVDARLEGLELLVELRQLTLKDATARYESAIPEVAFIST